MKNSFSVETIKDAINEIQNAISGENWIESFCKSPDGEVVDLFTDEETARKFITAVKEFGVFNDEDEMLFILKNAIKENAEEISEWCLNKRHIYKKKIKYGKNIGYVIHRKQNGEVSGKEETNVAEITLVKDKGNNTDFGFYVSSFHPVKE